VHLPVSPRRGGLRAGVDDLDCNASLLDLQEGDPAS
jgi:hypothetical protein